MTEIINITIFRAHVVRLERIFTRRLFRRYGEQFKVDILLDRHGYADLSLKRNASTTDARSDRATNEVCGHLAHLGNNSIYCSFIERWAGVGIEKYQFRQVGLIFFLKNSDGTAARQLFRLEWEYESADKNVAHAAHPHWQFDRWLTASDIDSVQSLKSTFVPKPDNVPIAFGTQDTSELARPSLRWFTKLHFPAMAPWATSPILDLDFPSQPHSTVPNSPEEIESWVDSALYYLSNELTVHGN
jgi:hypothetical protein